MFDVFLTGRLYLETVSVHKYEIMNDTKLVKKNYKAHTFGLLTQSKDPRNCGHIRAFF